MPVKACPMCPQNAEINVLSGSLHQKIVNCPRCGKYTVSHLMDVFLRDKNAFTISERKLMRYLAAYIRNMNDQGARPVLDEDNWREFALAHAGTALSVKLEKLLSILAGRVGFGEWARVDVELDAPLIDAPGAEEVNYVIESTRLRQPRRTCCWRC
jgi:hypothetical protein